AGGRVETVRKGATEKRASDRLRLTLPSGRGSKDGCCARAILRGTFLARGVLGNPADAYHLEMAVPAGATTLVSSGAARAGIPLKRTTRRGRTVYYLKGAEPISRMLGLMGANRAVMRFENDRILRDMRSQANRRANSETANMDKRLRAALQQRDAIRRLKARDNRLQSLPPALREVAELRLAPPRPGLRELEIVAVNDITDPPTLAHLLKYDSILGNFEGDVAAEGDHLRVDGARVKVFAERDPGNLPWKDLGIDIVIESTGLFTDATK